MNTTCPQCGAPIGAQQDWCLNCGTGARTRMVPTPNWRLPIAIALAIMLVAASALVVSLLALTGDSAPTTTVTAPAIPTASSTPAAPLKSDTTTAPATSTASATTTAPATATTG